MRRIITSMCRKTTASALLAGCIVATAPPASATLIQVDLVTSGGQLSTTGYGIGSVVATLGVFDVEDGGSFLLPSTGFEATITGLTEPSANGSYALVANEGGLTVLFAGLTAMALSGPSGAGLVYENLPWELEVSASPIGDSGSGYLLWGEAPLTEPLGSAQDVGMISTVVPQPSTASLALAGLLLLALLRRAGTSLTN